jgi:hypothetical protein
MTTALGSNTEKIFKLVKYWDRPTPDLNITQLEGHIVDCPDFTDLDPTTENDVFLVAEKDGSYHQCRCWSPLDTTFSSTSVTNSLHPVLTVIKGYRIDRHPMLNSLSSSLAITNLHFYHFSAIVLSLLQNL